MAYWNIGIDESGSFDYTNKQDKSFVCAALTQMSADELENVYTLLFKSENKRAHTDMKDLLCFFHAMEFKDAKKERVFNGLKDCISKVMISKGRPVVVGNPQHWWVAAVMTVLRSALESDLIKNGDVVDIAVATRSVAHTYSENIFASKDGQEYKEWGNYRNDIEKQLKKWIATVNKKNVKITLVCKSAKENLFVVLADQAGGMINLDQEKFLGSSKIDVIQCGDARIPSSDMCMELLENDDVVLALQLWLQVFLAKENIPFKMFHDIMDKAFSLKNDYVNVWKTVLDSCEYALDNRGDSPQLIDRVFKLTCELQNEYKKVEKMNPAQRAELGIDVHLLKDIWRVLAKISSHHGDTTCDVLDYVDCYWDSCGQEIGSTLDRWKFYLQTKLIGAQIPFNGYDFASVSNRLDSLLDCQEKIYELPFPFKNPAVDDDYAALLGTFGQAAAFQGDLDEAITCFEEDYACSSDGWKLMPASFLVTVYHRKSDYEQACAWFEKQTGGISFEDFGKTLSPKSDLWQVINYFKILALAQLDNRTVEIYIPDIESWDSQNSYPWPLVLKWGAFTLLLNDQAERGIALLEEAYRLLQKGGFTINTLALPILQMLYCVTEDEGFEAEYNKLLQHLTSSCATFKAYVETHSELFVLDKNRNFGEAAMILPFNYA